MWARAHPGQPHLPLLPSLLGYSFCLETSLLSRVGEQVCQLPGCGFPWTCPLLALQNQPPWGEGTSGPLLPPLLTVLKPEVSSPEVSSNTPWKAGSLARMSFLSLKVVASPQVLRCCSLSKGQRLTSGSPAPSPLSKERQAGRGSLLSRREGTFLLQNFLECP